MNIEENEPVTELQEETGENAEMQTEAPETSADVDAGAPETDEESAA